MTWKHIFLWISYLDWHSSLLFRVGKQGKYTQVRPLFAHWTSLFNSNLREKQICHFVPVLAINVYANVEVAPLQKNSIISIQKQYLFNKICIFCLWFSSEIRKNVGEAHIRIENWWSSIIFNCGYTSIRYLDDFYQVLTRICEK